MDNCHYISSEMLSLAKLQQIITEGLTLEFSEESKINIQKCRDYLDKKMATHDGAI